LRQLAGDVGIQFFRGNAVEHFQIGVAGALRVRRRQNVLAQIVETDQHSLVVAHARGGDRFGQLFAGYKAMRHPSGGPIGSDPARETLAFG